MSFNCKILIKLIIKVRNANENNNNVVNISFITFIWKNLTSISAHNALFGK